MTEHPENIERRDTPPSPVTLEPPGRRDGLRILARVATGFVALVACLWIVIYWVEAEKEVGVLCAMATPGKEEGEIHRMFSTGNLLRIDTVTAAGSTTLRVASPRNLELSGCTVRLAGGVVVDQATWERVRLPRVAAWTALLCLGWLVALQSLLASGAPLGRMAWGGAHERLPTGLRAASGVSAVVLGFGALCVAQVAGLVAVPLLGAIAWEVVAVLTLAFMLSIAGNLASSSARERWTGTPVAFLLAVCGVLLLIGGGPPGMGG